MQPVRRDSKPVDLSRKTYVTPFKLILFTLLALFFAAIVLWKSARRSQPSARRRRSGCSPPAGSSRPCCNWRSRAERTIQPAFAPRTAIIMLGGGTIYDDDARPRAPARRARAHSRRAPRTTYLQTRGGCLPCDRERRQSAAASRDGSRHLSALPAAPTGAAADIVLENRSLTTYENARNVSSILQAHITIR